MSFSEFEGLRIKHLAAVQLAENKVEDCRSANLIDLTPDTPIYRIFPIDRLLSTLNNKKLCLVRPKLWDDPFENVLFKSKMFFNNGRYISLNKIRDQFYGQCWSLKKECDGLWRNYTSNSCKGCDFDDFKKRHGHTPVSAKVKTTVGKLMEAFYDDTNTESVCSYFMGKVKYCSMVEIADFLEKVDILDTSNFSQVFSLLIKRDSFSYEEEVRLIFSKPGDDYGSLANVKNQWNNSDLFEFSVDPNTLFDEIEFDPWIDDASYDSFTQQIGQNYNVNVCKSRLYEDPSFVKILKVKKIVLL